MILHLLGKANPRRYLVRGNRPSLASRSNCATASKAASRSPSLNDKASNSSRSTTVAPSLRGTTRSNAKSSAETVSRPITAGRVIYFTDSGIARHDETRISVRREKMFLSGKGFLWTPDNRQIRVFEDVRLLIQEGGEGGLFPK